MAKEICHEAVRFLKGAMLVFLVLFVLLFILITAPWILTGTGILLTGWVNYPLRIVSDVTIDWTSVATAGVFLVLFAVGLHVFLKWMVNGTGRAAADRPWQIQSSLRVVTLIVFAFVAGMSTVGIVHQITWLSTTEEELLESNFWNFEQSAAPVNEPEE